VTDQVWQTYGGLVVLSAKQLLTMFAEKQWTLGGLNHLSTTTGKKYYLYFIDILLLFPIVKEFSKSVNF